MKKIRRRSATSEDVLRAMKRGNAAAGKAKAHALQQRKVSFTTFDQDFSMNFVVQSGTFSVFSIQVSMVCMETQESRYCLIRRNCHRYNSTKTNCNCLKFSTKELASLEEGSME